LSVSQNPDQGIGFPPLLFRHGEPIGGVPLGNDQKMPVRDGVSILKCEDQIPLFNYFVFDVAGAKPAIRVIFYRHLISIVIAFVVTL
jgi:hypothetical protein